MRKKSLVECYEERIQTLLNLKEANYRAYEELDKKAHDFSEWLEVRLREHEIQHHFAVSECYAIQQKFDEVFFAVKASPSDKQQEKQEKKTGMRKYCICGQKLTVAKEDGMFDGKGSIYCPACGLIHRKKNKTIE